MAILTANVGLGISYAPHAVAAQALEEVVVTARKREESVQDVPIAVSAFSAEQLNDAGVKNVKDMALQVPGVSIDSGSIAQVWIRGIGQRDTSSRIDGPTGIYVDGVYLARKEGQLLDVFDAESLQILRGPQGTLFGKNTTAGAMVITTRKPANEFGGEVTTRLGNYGRWDTKGMVNVPIIEDLLLSKLTLSNVKRDGYQTNIVDGAKMGSEDRQAANLQLRWLPADTVTVDSFFYAGKIRETAPSEKGQILSKSGYAGQDSLYANTMFPGDTVPVWPWEGDVAGHGPNPGMAETSPTYTADYLAMQRRGDYDVASNSPNKYNVDNYMAGVNVEWEINDSLALKSITGYGSQRVGAMAVNADNDGTPKPYQLIGVPHSSPREQLSQEFQLNGDAFDQRLSYTTGIFAMTEKVTDYNHAAGSPQAFMLNATTMVFTPPNAYDDKFKQDNKTLAGFFQGSYDLTDNLQATLGVRWTKEEREVELSRRQTDAGQYYQDLMDMGIPILGAAAPIAFNPAAVLAGDPLSRILSAYGFDKNGFVNYPLGEMVHDKQKGKWIETSPMASLQYKFPDEWLGESPIDSTMVYVTYSEGFKAGGFDVLGTKLSKLEPETVKNYEVGVKIDAFDRTVRLNVAAYKMKYDDQQVLQVIPEPDTGNTTVAYTNAGKSEITGVEAEFTWQPIDKLMINVGASHNDYDYKDFSGGELSTYHTYGQLDFPVVDRSSEPFAEVPSVTANVAVQYTFDLDGIGSLIPRISANYLSERYMGLDAGAGLVKDQSTLDAYTRVDARLAYRTLDERLEVALYVNNLTDKLYYDGAASVGDSVGVFPVIAAPPRMYGAEFTYKFGAL
jgi:outer membrane receptor protein involved in Fe transport